MPLKNDNLKDAVGKRLRIARESLGLTQKEFCDRIGMPLPTLRDQELCKRIPGGEAISAFMSAGISADWLLSGKGDMLQDSQESILAQYETGYKNKSLRLHESVAATYSAAHVDGYVAIPLYDDISAAAGCGAVVGTEQASTALMFREDWVHTELNARPADLCLISVRGNSMEPTLRASDTILIDLRTKVPDCEGIYVLRMGEVLLVKNLQLLPGSVLHVSSDNPAFKPFTIKLEDVGEEVAIIGRVVWVGRKI